MPRKPTIKPKLPVKRPRKPVTKKLTERQIEKKVCDYAKTFNIVPYKFVSPARRGVPDRLFLSEIVPEHRDIVARYVRFIEFKAPGKKPNPNQQREIERLQRMGFHVTVCDDEDDRYNLISMKAFKSIPVVPDWLK